MIILTLIVYFSEFFKAGNYLGAISAYSLGIKISDKMASLYVNRSAAHYALENYYRCIEDCSKVITRFYTFNLMKLKRNGKLATINEIYVIETAFIFFLSFNIILRIFLIGVRTHATKMRSQSRIKGQVSRSARCSPL